VNGGTLEFQLGPKPNTRFGTIRWSRRKTAIV
jgi:hypothetical protein